VRGDLLARAASRDAASLLGLSRVFAARGPGALRALRVASARGMADRTLLHFEGIDDREEAARLAGCYLLVPIAETPPLPPGRCYVFELIGLAVTTEEGRVLGSIVEVVENPANDVWVARGPSGEFLIPAVDAIVRKIDVPGGRVVIDPLPGLLPD
jgi:16S rRNA processing protein RimM